MNRSTQRLEEELRQLSKQLEVARESESAAEKRHNDENLLETERAQETRREEANRLRDRRASLVKELDRRAVEEKGWAPDQTEEGEALPGTGRAGALRIGPHPLLPERGFVIHDRKQATVVWVREVPTPARAAQLLRKHGVPWEEELLSHSLSPVPEKEEEEQR